MKKKGVLILNLGTPNSPSVKDVRVYLREFLNDPR
jgi:ferrochelatase